MGVLGSRIVVVGVGGSQNSCQLHAVVGCAQSPLPKAMVGCIGGSVSMYVVVKTEGVVGTKRRRGIKRPKKQDPRMC